MSILGMCSYEADNSNNCIQVFAAEGEFLHGKVYEEGQLQWRRECLSYSYNETVY